MLWIFHTKNITVEQRIRELSTKKGNTPAWITLWLERSQFGASEKNIRIIMLYVRLLSSEDVLNIKSDLLMEAIGEYYENL